MKRIVHAVVLMTLMAFIAGNAGAAKQWFHCYSADECEVTQENLIGPIFKSGDAKAAKRASQRIASVCVAAGFSHYQMLEKSSRDGERGFSGNLLGASWRGGGQQASATIHAKFFHEEVEGSYACSFAATKEYTKQARKIGKKNGYPWPIAPDSK